MALYEQFNVLFKEVIYKKEAREIVCEWLMRHPDYEAEVFWNLLVGQNQRPPLADLFASSVSPKYVFLGLNTILEQLSVQTLARQYNHPGQDGKVMLHLAWDNVMKPNSSTAYDHASNKDDSQLWMNILGKTDVIHWTWLDKPGEEPGEGLRNEMMSLLSNRPSESLADLANFGLEHLSKVYPSRPKITGPEDSPWRYAVRKANIDALVTLGHKIDEQVKVGDLQVPAWQWLILYGNKPFTESGNFHVAIKDTMEKQGIEGFEEYAANFSRQVNRWSCLVPSDRREKTGYVARVMKFALDDKEPFLDMVGSSSLDYLLTYRPDLFGIFASKAMGMDSELFKQRFMQPDLAGVPAILRYISRLGADGRTLFDILLDHHGCWEDPEELIKNKGGLFAWNTSMTPWIKSKHSKLNPLAMDDFSIDVFSQPDFFFGPPQKQKEWSKFLEDNISHWATAREVFNKVSYSVKGANPLEIDEGQRFALAVSPMLELFLPNAKEECWIQGLDQDLASNLHVAANYMTSGIEKNINDGKTRNWFSGLHKYSIEFLHGNQKHTYNNKGWTRVSRQPPEYFTPAILEWLTGPEGEKALTVLDAPTRLPDTSYAGERPDGTPWAIFTRREALRAVSNKNYQEDIRAPKSTNVPKM